MTNPTIVMTSSVGITKVLKRTKAKLFKDVEVGDALNFSVPIEAAGMSQRGTHASYITVTLVPPLADNSSTYLSFNQIGRYLDMFEYEVLK